MRTPTVRLTDQISPEHNFSGIKREEGQTLIQVAIMMIVLIGFVALAVDVGNVYAIRRKMQNAADAGALAGAFELCQLSNEAVARAQAALFMRKNGDTDAADADVTINVNKVTARASTSATTFLAGAIGFPVLGVVADAQSACGAATSGCGLWPIGFSQDAWQNIYDNGAGCGKQFAVWTDSTTTPPTCTIGGVPQKNLCGCYDCDLDNNGEDDFAVLNSEGRAWLDYSEAVLPYTDSCTAPGCGTSELSCHIRYDSGAKIDLPKCISGDNGVRAGVKDDVMSRVGQNLSIALYDSLGCATSNCPGGTTFHVTKLGCITVVSWDQNFELDLISDPRPPNRIKGKVMWVKMLCGNECTTSCGSTDGTVPLPYELTAANLIR